MAGLQLSGLASGFDWVSFVDQMMELERTPITRLESEKSKNSAQATALSTLNGKLTALRSATKALDTDGLFTGRTATLTSGSSSWKTSASAATAAGSYTFNVTQRATASKLSGSADVGEGLAPTSDVSGVTLASMRTAAAVTAGTFTINGSQVAIALTDSLQDVFDKISTATSGAVTATYDPATDHLQLASAGEIVLGAANDTSNFLAIAKLANNGTGAVESGGALGATSTSATLANAGLRAGITAVDAGGNGSFAINGVSIDYNINTDSLSTLMARINASSAGVTASFDRTSDRLVLTNKNTGDVGVSVSEDAGGLLGALGLTGASTTLTRGDNALFTVNGGDTLSSTSNTLTADAHGITGLSITAASIGSETVNVAADAETMRSKIDAFIAAFNDVQTYIDAQTKVTTKNDTVSTSTLSNNREVQSWASALRSAAFGAVSGLDSTLQRLEHIGIDFSSTTSTLSVTDSSKLQTALSENSEKVSALFRTGSTGLAARFNGLLDTYIGVTDSGGQLEDQTERLTASNRGIDEQIAAIERRLEQRRAQLEAAFIAMETAQSKIQQMQTQLTNAFSSSSSSSSSK